MAPAEANIAAVEDVVKQGRTKEAWGIEVEGEDDAQRSLTANNQALPSRPPSRPRSLIPTQDPPANPRIHLHVSKRGQKRGTGNARARGRGRGRGRGRKQPAGTRTNADARSLPDSLEGEPELD